MDPQLVRNAAVAVMIGAAVLLAAYYLVGPDVRANVPGVCDNNTLDGQSWPHIRDGQLGRGVIGYDADEDVTYIAPGCGHDHSKTALRVQGDHSDLPEGFRMLLRPDGPIPGSTSPVPDDVWAQQGSSGPKPPGAPPMPAWDGEFRVASPLVLAWPLVTIVGLAGGLGLLLFSTYSLAIKASPAVAAAAGVGAALMIYPDWVLMDIWGYLAGLLAILGGSIAMAARFWLWHPSTQAGAAAAVLGLASFAAATAILYPTYPYIPMM